MNFNDVSPHIDLCSSSLENQEQCIRSQKEQIQLQLNIFISWQFSLFSSYWVQRLRENEHKAIIEKHLITDFQKTQDQPLLL